MKLLNFFYITSIGLFTSSCKQNQQSDKGKGNNNVEIHCSFFDRGPFSGESFYRIKIIEGGKATYSQILKVNTINNSGNKLVVYSNP